MESVSKIGKYWESWEVNNLKSAPYSEVVIVNFVLFELLVLLLNSIPVPVLVKEFNFSVLT